MKSEQNINPKVAINFDLIVKECKTVFGGSRSKAYNVLKKDLTEHSFKHDQGSGYISQKGFSRAEILSLLGGLVQRQPWLMQCCKKIRITQIYDELFSGLVHKDLLKAAADIAAQQYSPLSPIPKTTNREQMKKSPTDREKIAEEMKKIKSELQGKSPNEIAKMSEQYRSQNNLNSNKTTKTTTKPTGNNGNMDR